MFLPGLWRCQLQGLFFLYRLYRLHARVPEASEGFHRISIWALQELMPDTTQQTLGRRSCSGGGLSAATLRSCDSSCETLASGKSLRIQNPQSSEMPRHPSPSLDFPTFSSFSLCSAGVAMIDSSRPGKVYWPGLRRRGFNSAHSAPANLGCSTTGAGRKWFLWALVPF